LKIACFRVTTYKKDSDFFDGFFFTPSDCNRTRRESRREKKRKRRRTEETEREREREKERERERERERGGETRGFRIGVCLPSPRRKCRSEWQLRCGRRGRESSQELLTLRQLSSHRPRITTRFNVPPPEKSSRTRANGAHFSERVAENSSRSRRPSTLHAPVAFP